MPTRDPSAVSLGRRGGLKGGAATSEAKAAAARENGRKGGRPRLTEEQKKLVADALDEPLAGLKAFKRAAKLAREAKR